MGDLIKMNRGPLEYRGQRVITFGMIDSVHGIPAGTAKARFNDNRQRYSEDEEFFKIEGSELKSLFASTNIVLANPSKTRSLILLTEPGYLLVCKSLTDDKAWIVQKHLIKNYFRAKET